MAQKAELIRGDDQTINIETPDHNLSGGTVFFTLKTRENITPINLTDSNALLKKPAIITGDHTAYVEITHDDTKNIAPGKYFFDVQLLDQNSKVTTIFKTTQLDIIADVTQRIV